MRYSSQIFITERSIDMPVIDFHTHVFPEAIAEKTISMLAQKSNSQPFGNGTFSSLLSNMQTSGVTHSVTLPVVTRPKQFDSILKYAIAMNIRRFLPLAAFIQTTQHRKNTCCKSNRLDFTASSCIQTTSRPTSTTRNISAFCESVPIYTCLSSFMPVWMMVFQKRYTVRQAAPCTC